MTWNGYGLSFWRWRCGAARRVTGLMVRAECIAEIRATSCKRCGTDEEPVVCLLIRGLGSRSHRRPRQRTAAGMTDYAFSLRGHC